MRILYGLVLSALSQLAGAQVIESGRVAARGSTFVAQPYSNQSAFQQVSSLAQSPYKFQWRPMELHLSIGQNVINTASELVEDSKLADSQDSGAFINLLERFEDKFGKRHLGRIDVVLSALRFGGFEIAPFASSENYLEVRSPSIPTIDLLTNNRFGIQMAYGWTMFKDFEFGLAIRPTQVVRLGGDLVLTDALEVGESSEVSERLEAKNGFGTGVDIGAAWNVTKTFRLALHLQDFGDMGYQSGSEKLPANLEQRASLGFWYRYEMASKWNLDFTGDWQDLVNRSGANILRQTHFGVELGKAVFSTDHDFGVSMGVSSGYISYGAFADIWLFRLELARSTEELGLIPGQRPDERLHISMTSSVSF